MSVPEFAAWPKIARLNRSYVITEKLDGTNACVIVDELDGQVHAQSRTRIITPGKTTDNYGFAAWVEEHADELREGLGAGYHYGEWWGDGIQRRYGLDEKRFSLFNSDRWADDRPACCHVVPVLARRSGSMDADVERTISDLREYGSVAAPGFKPAEGIVVYHSASRQLFKVTCEGDASPKGVAA